MRRLLCIISFAVLFAACETAPPTEVEQDIVKIDEAAARAMLIEAGMTASRIPADLVQLISKESERGRIQINFVKVRLNMAAGKSSGTWTNGLYSTQSQGPYFECCGSYIQSGSYSQIATGKHRIQAEARSIRSTASGNGNIWDATTTLIRLYREGQSVELAQDATEDQFSPTAHRTVVSFDHSDGSSVLNDFEVISIHTFVEGGGLTIFFDISEILTDL